MKTKEELSTIIDEVEALNKKLTELTEDELQQISGGDLEYNWDNLRVSQSGSFSRCPIFVCSAHDVCYLSDIVRKSTEKQYSCSSCSKNPNK